MGEAQAGPPGRRRRLGLEAPALDGHPRGSRPPRRPLRRMARGLQGIQLHWPVNSYTNFQGCSSNFKQEIWSAVVSPMLKWVIP